MDTSLSKALIMVAGVLLAMIVIAFMNFSFRKMGTWATASDDQLLIEQKDKFNKEYEVYDKDLMYGVDVISCLNKAKTNNDKITDNKYINGNTYDITDEIKVKFTLKKSLEESITVYHMNDKKEYAFTTDNGPSGNIKLSDVKFSFLDKDYLRFSSFDKNTFLKTKSQICKKTETEFQLTAQIDGSNGTNEASLRDLLTVSDELSEIIKNTDKTTSANENSWTKAEFRSALYDLKTRKFKCTKLNYSSESGRINEIEFKEI